MATGWRNLAPAGQPPQFVVTEWRDPTPQERKAARLADPVSVQFEAVATRAQDRAVAKVRARAVSAQPTLL